LLLKTFSQLSFCWQRNFFQIKVTKFSGWGSQQQEGKYSKIVFEIWMVWKKRNFYERSISTPSSLICWMVADKHFFHGNSNLIKKKIQTCMKLFKNWIHIFWFILSNHACRHYKQFCIKAEFWNCNTIWWCAWCRPAPFRPQPKK